MNIPSVEQNEKESFHETFINWARANNIPYLASNSLGNYLSDKSRETLKKEVEEAFNNLLKALLIDVKNDHNTNETAKRVSKMFIDEIFSGRYHEEPTITAFPNVEINGNHYDGMYVTGPIPIRSTCAHHFQNITGKCWIGVFPNKDSFLGLSKFARLVDHIASRPSIQEEMSLMIADAVSEKTNTEDVAIFIQGEHHCMSHRGVRVHGAQFTTPIMRGVFTKNRIKQEFYNIIKMSEGK